MSIITTSFIQLARITSRSLGLPDQCFVVVPHPMGGVSWEVLKAKIDRAFPDILDASTKWSPAKADKKRARPAYPAQTIKIKGNVLDVQRAFLERGWAAGIPFVPPTKDLVEQMLKGTSHPPGEVVWDGVPPRMGVATVELVAACAAMAGCKPEYMPLILAVIEGLKEPAVDIVHQSTTTGTENLLCVVNGPIAKELGLSCGTGAAGLCYHANASIGYAIGLIGKVIGGSKPPDTDKSTLGSPADLFHFVLAENEEESPWEPYAVEHGYKLTDNVVTVKVAYQPLDISEHNSTDGEDILNYTAYSINQPYTICMRHAPVVIGWCPEHAATLAKDGYTKDDIRRYLWEHARYPAKALSKTWWDRGACRPNEDFPDVGYGSQSLLPIVARPEDIQMIVCGGAGKHSQFWPGPKAMASKSIDPWR
ncbi:MAG: thiol-disulfide oxidoreductase [Chloroflexi bacterium]|nr:thiol-disulfide oxidoreductase [Chloroflexota bacterium]